MGRALITIILFYETPNSTAQMLLSFSPKVSTLCVLITLISRVHITRPRGQDVTSSVQSKRTGASSTSRPAEESTYYSRLGSTIHL